MTKVSLHTQVKDVRQKPARTDEIPVDSRSGIPAPVPNSVSGLVPDHSWIRTRYSDTVVVYFKSFIDLEYVNCIFNISMYVHMLLYPYAHYDHLLHCSANNQNLLWKFRPLFILFYALCMAIHQYNILYSAFQRPLKIIPKWVLLSIPFFLFYIDVHWTVTLIRKTLPW
jgi:hypothetical protein